MTSAAEHYAARVGAYNSMRDRWRGGPREDPWDALVEGARWDPRRVPDENLKILLSYVQPDDAVLDVGGGAGRIGLPIALHCRELTTVDPSPAMHAAFDAAAREARIRNARYVEAPWPNDKTVVADVALTTHVTYFVRDIVPFLEALDRAGRRRVIISIWSQPPPTQGAEVYAHVFGGPFEAPPGHRELLPVLWEMGLLPEVRVLPLRMQRTYSWLPQPTRQATVEHAVKAVEQHGSVDTETARRAIDAGFDMLFGHDEHGYFPHWPTNVREMLITWEHGGSGM